MSAKAYEALSKSNELTSVNETAQSPEQRNDDEKERKKRIRGTLIKFGSLAVFAFIVWVFATIAWFSGNASVSSDGIGIRVGSSPFELKTVGYYGFYDNHLPEEIVKLDPVTNGSSGISGVLSTANSPSIQWLITPNENAKNYITEDTKEDDKGIRPGTSGELKFWIVPKEQATVNVSFQLRVTAYKTIYKTEKQVTGSGSETAIYIDSDTKEPIEDHIELITNQADTLNYLKSHIMFFKKHNNDGTYSGLITPESTFTLIPDGNGGYTSSLTFAVDEGELQDKELSVFWVWPETLAETLLTTELQGNGKKPVCANTNDEVRNSFKDDPTKYLVDYNAAIDTDGALNSELTTNIIKQYYSRLSVEYNNADQNIGDNVGYILLELVALS